MSKHIARSNSTSSKRGLVGLLAASAVATTALLQSGCGAILVASAIQANTNAQRQIAHNQEYLARNAKGIEEFYKCKSSMTLSRTISASRHLIEDKTRGNLYISDLANEGILFEGTSGPSFAVIPYHEIDKVTPKIALMSDFINFEYTTTMGERRTDAYMVSNGGIVTELAQFIAQKRDEAKRLAGK